MKPATKAPAPTAAPTAPRNEPKNTDIDGIAALDGLDDAGLIMTARGRARCQSALSGIESITNILFQLELDKGNSGGIQANTSTTAGLLQALSVCTEFLCDHIDGGGNYYSMTIDGDTQDHAATARELVARMGRPS